MMSSKEMLRIAIDALEEKKGQKVKVIDISDVTVIADYFIIASGSNLNQIQAMAEEVEEKLGRAGVEPKQIEGKGGSGWILMDYQDIIIHIFNEEQRLFYDIERIWSDGKPVDTDSLK